MPVLCSRVPTWYSTVSMRSRVFSRAGELARPSPSGGAPLGEGELQPVRVAPKYLHSNATSHKWPLGAIAELLDNAIDEVANGCERCSSRPRLRCIPASDLLHLPLAPRLSFFVPHGGIGVCSVLGDWLTQPISVCTRSPSGTFVAVDVEDWWDISGDPKRSRPHQGIHSPNEANISCMHNVQDANIP